MNGTSISYSSMSECGPRVKTCMDDLARQLNASVVDNVFYYNDANGITQVNLQFKYLHDVRGQCHELLRLASYSSHIWLEGCGQNHNDSKSSRSRVEYVQVQT
jgi:hypothetical protein